MASNLDPNWQALASPGFTDALRTILGTPGRDAEAEEASRLADQAVADFEAGRDQQAALVRRLTDYALTLADHGKE